MHRHHFPAVLRPGNAAPQAGIDRAGYRSVAHHHGQASGHMGARNTTELGLRVVRVDAERNLLFVRGSVPGPMNGLVTVRKQGGPSRHD